MLTRFPHVGIIAPVQLMPGNPPAPIASAFSDPTLAREVFRLLLFSDVLAARFHLGAWRRAGRGAQRVDWLMGAALLFRWECWNTVRGFDETEFMYGEDWDICYRARQAGWDVYLVPGAQIIHHSNAAARQLFHADRQARVLKANLYFHEKHYGVVSRRALALFNFIGSILRLMLFVFAPSRWRAQVALARVALHGMG
jgi:GT2 family glycosyltransferase